jgi:BMFP domain-containing protein YqiC
MPKYRALETSFISGRIVKEGEEVDYDGEPGPNLEPADDLAKKVIAKFAKTPTPVQNLAAQVRQHAATRGATPDAVIQEDFDAVVQVLPNKPSADTLAQTLKLLGLPDPAASVA